MFLAGCLVPDQASPSRDGRVAVEVRGWARDVVESRQEVEALLRESQGWSLLQRGHLHEAVSAFESSKPTATTNIGLIRAHLALGEMYAEVSLVMAEATVGYLRGRSELGLLPFRRQASVLLEAQWLLDRSRRHAGCVSENEAPQRWTALRRESCRSPRFERSAWLSRATTPLVSVDIGSPAVKSASLRSRKVHLHDPLILRALANAHFSEASRLASNGGEVVRALARLADMELRGSNHEGPKRELASRTSTESVLPQENERAQLERASVLFSRWATLEERLGPTPEPPADPATLDAEISMLRGGWERALEVLGDREGRRIGRQLSLAEWMVAGRLRVYAAALLEHGRCLDAFGLLEASRDIAAADRLSALNGPHFFALFARASTCAGRLNEAMGALLVLAGRFEELSGAEDAMRRYAATRLMGDRGDAKTAN